MIMQTIYMACGVFFESRKLNSIYNAVKNCFILYTFYASDTTHKHHRFACKGSGEVWYRQDTKRGSNSHSSLKRSPQTPPMKCKFSSF